MNVFKHLRWRIEYGAYLFLEFILHRLSPERVYQVGHYLGLLCHSTFRSRRNVVQRNLRVIHGTELSLDEIKTLSRKVFSGSGSNLLSAIRSSNFSKSELDQRLHFTNLDEIQRLANSRQGLILILPHMGNWEVLSQLIRYLSDDLQVAGHYRKLDNPYLDAHALRQRTRHGTKLISKDTSPHAMAALLRDGGTLFILADQRALSAGYWCSYYGQFTSCSPLPEILAKRTGASIACLSMQTISPAHWQVTAARVEDTSTPSCMAAFEQATRRSPSDVFWFQDRWRIDELNPFGVEGKEHRQADQQDEEKPLRLLIWHSSPDAELPQLPKNRRALLHLELAYPEGTTPPTYPYLPWSKLWPIDSSTQAEHFEDILRKIDESEPLPLGGLVQTVPFEPIRKASRRLSITYCSTPAPLLPLP